MERLMSDGNLNLKNTTAESEVSLKGFRFLADSVPEIIWTAQPDGNLDYYNQRWFDYTGLTLEQTKDWGWRAVLHPDDLQRCVDRWTHSYTNGEDYEIEYRFKRASDQSFRWHLGRATAMRGENGKIVQWVGTCTDIDDFKRSEKALRDSEERIHIVLENLTEGLVISNMEGELIYWNRAGLEMHGFTGIDEGRRMLPDAARIFDLRTLDGTLLTVDQWPLTRVFRGEVLRNFDAQIQRRDIEWSRIFSYGGALVQGTTGQQLAFVTITDITSRKQAEEALREVNESLEQKITLRTAELSSANHQLQAVLDASTDVAIIAANPQGEITLFNRGAENMLGYRSEEVLGLNPAIFHVEAEVVARGRELTEEYGRPIAGFDTFCEPVRQGKHEEREWTFVRKDGTTFPVTLVLTASHGSGGQIDGFLGVAMDITGRKEAEASLEDVARRLRLATQVSGIGVWDWDLRTNQILWDEQMFALHGMEPTEVTYDTWAGKVFPEDLAEQSAILQETVRQRGRSERQFRIRRDSDGELRIIHASEVVVLDSAGEARRIVGVNRDITARETSTAQLAASEELLNQFIKHTPAAIAMLDTGMRYMNSSNRWLKDYHLEDRDIIGRSHYEVFPDVSQRWKEIHQRVLAGAVEKCDEDPFRRADGGMEWLQWEARPWHRQGGEIGGLVFYTQVITARKEAEAQLRESEERFRGAFQNSAVGMALVSLEGHWIRVNDALCEIVGRTEAELLACSFQDITHPDDLATDMDHLRSLLSGEIDHYQMEKRYFHKSGRIVWVLLAVTLVRSTNGQPVHFVSQINDITLRLESAARLQSSLSEKEVLLREIHHRVKNNMQVITSLLQLQSGYLHDPRDAEIFRECQSRIHAMGLVHDRLYRSGNLATIDFSAHLRDLIALIVRGQSHGPERIQVTVESDPVEVNLDTAIPLGLITTELITNAYKHAFPQEAPGTIHVHLTSTGDGGLTLRVEDNGVGLPAELDTQKARTLGMRLIRALCQQLRAEISISSSDTGSQIQISFQPDLSLS